MQTKMETAPANPYFQKEIGIKDFSGNKMLSMLENQGKVFNLSMMNYTVTVTNKYVVKSGPSQ